MSITKAQFARMIDHTLLKNTAIRKDIELLCSEALEFGFASVCLFPGLDRLVFKLTHDSRHIFKLTDRVKSLDKDLQLRVTKLISSPL